MTDAVIAHADNSEPTAFTQKELGWLPWLEPLPETGFTERHRAALVDAARIKSAYFRLLARDPDILAARTRTDKDIFYNPDDGLPRAERELAAAADVPRQRLHLSAPRCMPASPPPTRSAGDVQRLLDEGVGADIDPRWNAVIAASVALTATPARHWAPNIAALRDVGLDDARHRRPDRRRSLLQLGQPADGRAAGWRSRGIARSSRRRALRA